MRPETKILEKIILDTRMITPISLIGAIATKTRQIMVHSCKTLEKATLAFPEEIRFHRKLDRLANIGAAVIKEIVKGDT